LTTAYGSSTPFHFGSVTSHSELVDGLTSNSVYHYHVRSRDVAGTLAGSSDFKFVSRATDFAVRITFDARSTGTLNEQYPTGVIPWGNGTWLGSRTVVAFSGNCTSFAGEGYFVGSFRFQNRLPLLSVDAYKGDATAATVTLSCHGQLGKQVTLAAGQLFTLATCWQDACSPVTISSTNSWRTNFNNLVVD